MPRGVHKTVIISPTYFLDSKWRMVDGMLNNNDRIYTEYDPQVLAAFYSDLVKRAARGQNTLLIMDDVTTKARTGGHAEGLLNRIICNAIHLRCSVIYSAQRIVHTTVDMRENADYFIGFNCVKAKERNLIFDNFGKGSKRQFSKVYDYCTEGSYHFICVDLSGPQIIYRHNFNVIHVNFGHGHRNRHGSRHD